MLQLVLTHGRQWIVRTRSATRATVWHSRYDKSSPQSRNVAYRASRTANALARRELSLRDATDNLRDAIRDVLDFCHVTAVTASIEHLSDAEGTLTRRGGGEEVLPCYPDMLHSPSAAAARLAAASAKAGYSAVMPLCVQRSATLAPTRRVPAVRHNQASPQSNATCSAS